VVKIQKVIIILSRKVRNNQVCACWKWVFAFVKKCLGQFSSDIFYSSHIRIYQVETEMYFCANFLFKSTLPLKPRCVVWKQYKKYPPTFPFSFFLIKLLPKKEKQESKRLKYGKCAISMAFLKPLLTMACFGSNCCFLNFLAHDLTPYQMDKEGKVSIKIQQILFFNGWWG